MRFCNKTMRQPVQGKPHLALIGGYWRVSPKPPLADVQHRIWWGLAHNVKDLLNADRHHFSRR